MQSLKLYQLCYLLTLLLLGTGSLLQAQVIKGSVIDEQSEMPLIGASVQLLSADGAVGTTTDLDGRFRIEGIPVGRHVVQVAYLGYESVTIPNLLVTAGKDLNLDIKVKESIIEMNEVVVTADVEKDRANNEMATISTRQFSLEEVTRYSGGRNDASRMAANFAGVNIANDSRNDLVIRGNSPLGVLWRLEGTVIPNPNHFATFGTTGGPVSALNTNLLSNSDFMTSAFPAEYGNATAGVFDIKFRSGNLDRFEYTAQLSAFSGLEFMAEGPLSKKKTGSFLVSYRHSFVELAQEAGLSVGTAATPAYRDLSFKIDFGRGAKSKWSLFGIGGTSHINFIGSELEEDDFFAEQNQDSYAESTLGIIGLNHSYLMNPTTYIKTTLSASTAQNKFHVDEYLPGAEKERTFETDDRNTRFNFNSYLNKKFSAKHSIRAGISAELYDLDVFTQDRAIGESWIPIRDFKDQLGLLQAYVQSQYRLSQVITINSGLHAQYLTLNSDFVLEPRLALNWRATPSRTFNVGFGIHHQMQPLPIYLFETPMGEAGYARLNADLAFSRSIHYVVGMDQKLGSDWRLKLETYYQRLSQIPIDQELTSFSIINVGDDFGFPSVNTLVNNGTGENYGLELTLEKFFSKGFYGLLTGSLFDSNYRGSDGVNRNTSFNNQYILNFLAGKEFKIGKDQRNAITFDMKFTTTGGRYFTPIDLALSQQFDREIKVQNMAYSERYNPYLRLDLKFGYQLNSKKRRMSQQFFIDFQNVTNHQNVFLQRYNSNTGTINTVYQIGFFPDILYRVQF